MPNTSLHIFEAGERREARAVEFLLRQPIAADALRRSMGVSGVPWFAIRVPTDLLVEDEDLREHLPGDVDLIAGELRPDPAFVLQRAGNTLSMAGAHPSWPALLSLMRSPPVWPPDLTRLAAAEFKACYLSTDRVLKATKRGRLQGAYAQAAGLARMGFSQVYLNWLVATAPVAVQGTNTANFLDASSRAYEGQRGVAAFLELDPEHQFGQWVFGSGSVSWASETHAGTFSAPHCFSPAPLLDVPSDPCLGGVRSWLEGVFNACAVPPATAPLFIRVCSSRTCRRGFLAEPGDEARCPSCSSAAT